MFSCNINQENKHSKEWNNWHEDNTKIRVLCTTAMIHDIVTCVGGRHINSLPLIVGELDPHSYELVKGDDEKFTKAEIIFYNGLGLEHSPSMQAHLIRHSNVIGVGDWIYTFHPSLILIDIDTNVPDPHVWMDVSIWKEIATPVAQALSFKDPTHREEYFANAQQIQERLENLHMMLKEQMHSVSSKKRYLVTSHDAFQYFARAYLREDFERDWMQRVNAPEGLAPESQISANDIQKLINYMEKHHVEVVFPESNVSPDSLKKIMDAGTKKGMKIIMATTPIYGDSMGNSGSYENMMTHNVQVISKYLRNNDE